MELELFTRTMIVARVWMAVEFYFAHWQDVPLTFDLEAEIKDLMQMALDTPDRLKFGLSMMRFFSKLNNSHTWYQDSWLNENYFWKRGFNLRPDGDHRWLVIQSGIDDLPDGEALTHIDDKSCEQWFAEIRPYINASSERIARRAFGQYLPLFTPDTSTLTLADGRKIAINRHDAKSPPPRDEWSTSGEWLVENRVAKIYIPSFNEDRFENRALELVGQFKSAQCIIIDLRDCSGGNTPTKLINALMNRPYRMWMEGTPAHFGLFRYRNQERVWQYPHAITKGDVNQGYYDAMEEHFKHPMLVWDAPVNTPDADAYTGKLIILTSMNIASAGEDFLIPFKNTGRATLMGETTFGSTGQPYHYHLSNGIWLAVGTKRAYFPDGSRYEGVGIRPDVEVIPGADDLRSGKDVVMERALALATEA